jgi:hypothetical protein
MTIKGILTAALAASMLAACGGGGGSGPPPPPPPPTLTPANTANPAFLPLASGNTWTLQTGKMTDIGLITILCSCTINNKQIERVNLIAADGSFAGALYFAKGNWPNAPYAGHHVTYLVGVRTATANGVTLAYQSSDGTIPGYPIMDDTPVAGQTFSMAALNPPDSSVITIQSVGGTQAYGVNQVINSIATAALTQSGSTATFSLAQGVGFTNFNSSTTTNLLVSFAIDAVNSKSVVRGAAESMSTGNATSALRSVLDRF